MFRYSLRIKVSEVDMGEDYGVVFIEGRVF